MQTKHTQEWLTYHGIPVAIDGICGPATRAALKIFQAARHLTITGDADSATIAALEQPLVEAAAIFPPGANDTLWDLIVRVARQHLAKLPIEIGGQNRGPWVRHYMRGKEGTDWPWCAGFVSTIVYQAFACAARPVRWFAYTTSCDRLALDALQLGTFDVMLAPGAIFLVRGKKANDWVHTGIVTDVDPANRIMHTIEGNTNDSGDREGYEVCARTRSIAGKDFIVLPREAA